jgi:DNA-binding CsgD family transcriptional regulator
MGTTFGNSPHRRDPASGSAIFSDEAWATIARSLGLSGRECQIVRAVFDDQTEWAMAANLGISINTVHTHVARLHHKLSVVDRVALVLLVVNEFLRLTTAPGSMMPPLCAVRVAGQCPRRPSIHL